VDALMGKLMSRCKRVPDLIAESVRGRVNPFPEWRDAKGNSRSLPIESRRIDGLAVV
jgi:hypothetical protein